MNVLDHLAEAAAALLLLELLVVLLLFLGISGGLAWGLHWVLGKTDWAFGKVNGYVAIGRKYLHTGTDYIAKPFILGTSLGANVRETARALRDIVRRTRRRGDQVAARPFEPAAIPPERITYGSEAADRTMVQPIAVSADNR